MAKKKILIIDDKDFIIKLLGKMMNRYGHDFISAENGKEGLMKYQENKELLFSFRLF